jgi:hypothetical protein
MRYIWGPGLLFLRWQVKSDFDDMETRSRLTTIQYAVKKLPETSVGDGKR